MLKTSKATEAAMHARGIRWYIRHNYPKMADEMLGYYRDVYGNTKGYNRLSRDVQFAIHNQSKVSN